MTRTLAVLWLLVSGPLLAADGSPSARSFLERPPDWFRGAEALRIADNLVSWQAANGAWEEQRDFVSQPFAGDRATLEGTFDDKATVDEIRFLARVVAAGEARPAHRAAFDRGLVSVLGSQYENGGWPHYPPPAKGYHRFITFNDNTVARLMWLVREVAESPAYGFVEPRTRSACRSAFDRGIECILRCQIVVDGRPTVWCAQHDERDLSPRPARSYELASFSGMESVELTRLLMSVERPTPEIRAAVEGAVAWLDAHRIRGVRVENRNTAAGEDRVVVADASAPDLWARFYDLRTGRPLFCGRDGVPRESLAEIERERRVGYSWYGEYARDLLAKDYPAWKQRR